MKYIYILIFVLLFISCENNPYHCALDPVVLSFNDSIERIPDYRENYPKHFEKYGEQELEDHGVKSYRLFVNYSFYLEPWIYRFEKSDEGGRLTIKKNYKDSFEDSTSFRDTVIVKALSIDQWKGVEEIFEANCFWTLPAFIDRRGLDGRTCILEAFDPDRDNPVYKNYFIASRWEPEENTSFLMICNYIQAFEPEPEFY
ncbi:MAG: hypothetical protein RL204_1064 [Bacteroidota bacterium]|jgi:hypothetical protein